MDKLRWRLSSSQIILLGFMALILTGSLLLTLPAASRTGGVPYADALFTATSAVCVTGLVVRDTVTAWTPFGQAVILVLIQIGGMGVVTVAASISALSGRRIGLKQRSTIQEALSAPKVGGIVRLTGFILRMTLIFELLGTAALAPVFCRDFGLLKGLWYAVFHSISAFCNAGFDLMGTRAPYSSLTGYAAQPVVNAVIMLLIIIGGIGFMTWDDVRAHGLYVRRYSLQSKVILTVTGLLILLPAAYFYALEFTGFPAEERVWRSLFQAVTPRTAGFNTTDLSTLSESGRIVTIMLMLIGGSPGSTAGGMKTTTLMVLLATAVSVFRRRESTHCFGRRLPEEALRGAATLLVLYLTLALSAALVISRTEQLPLLTCLFETASAIGTVGLSLGVMPALGTLSRVLLILLMYVGRVGGLTLIFSTISPHMPAGAKLPQEKLTVG